eukprot:gene15793-24126_t
MKKAVKDSGGESSAVKVFVRVRPHNQREIDAANKGGDGLKCVVKMKDSTCSILDITSGTVKNAFSFDGCIWSIPDDKAKCVTNFNAAKECNPFFSQADVYQLCGAPMVRNVLEGYNSCLFAYGQTGSGKTHTMMGKRDDPENKGIIPRICTDVLTSVKGKKDVKFKIAVSYIEIYNEMVRDLLTAKKGKDTLRVRQ